jgi:hypothetical protein
MVNAASLLYIWRQMGISHWHMHGLSIVYMFIVLGRPIYTNCASLRTGTVIPVDGKIMDMSGWLFCIDTYSTSTSATSRVSTVVMCEIDAWHSTYGMFISSCCSIVLLADRRKE